MFNCNFEINIKQYILLNTAIFILFLLPSFIFSEQDDFVTHKVKSGEGITILFSKYFIPINRENLDKFRQLNKSKILKNDELIKNSVYSLPIVIYKYNGKNLRKSLNIESKQLAEKIKGYNTKVINKNLKKSSYQTDGLIWVPYSWLLSKNENTENVATDEQEEIVEKPEKQAVKETEKNSSSVFEPLFGKKYEKVKILDKKLKGHYYYIKSGHGGPDPGAIGNLNNHELCEDEYAYDVILRLARRLMEHSASVYIIVQDSTNGIRDESYLEPDNNEVLITGDTISHIQSIRLKNRADIINNLYKKNQKKAKSQQSVIIHLDSRLTKKRIDIFFYHQENNTKSEFLANTLFNTIKEKYEQYQPGRGYKGSVTTRNLFMLRNLLLPTVYIELGNIQNKNDQIRFIDKNNRQAIANWLSDGLINAVKSKEKK